mgnify:CR=1 FL=1
MADQGGFCTECGAAVSSTDRFCAGCGHNLGGGVPVSSTSSKPRASLQQNASRSDFGIPKWGWRIILPWVAIIVIAIWWALPSTESETSRDLVLSDEYWTPPMIQHMRIEFMADCKETAFDQPEMRSAMEQFSATPLAVCVCASEFAMNNWTPAELVEEVEERPSNFAYELGGGVLACLMERAD